MIKNLQKIIAIAFITISGFSFAAAADQLPEVITGQTTVTTETAIGSLSLTNKGWVQIDNISVPSTLGNFAFSVTAWIKPTDRDSQYQTIMGQGRVVSSNANTLGWAIGLVRSTSGDYYQVQVSAGTSSKYTLPSTGPTDITDDELFDGNWHFIGFTYNPASTTPVNIAFDSAYEAGTTLASAIGSIGNTSKVIIGNSTAGCAGFIDEVRIYNNIALDATSMGILANQSQASANTVSPGNLFARWDFHEGTGTKINDLSGNGYHGTLKTDSSWGPDIASVASTYYGGFMGNEAVYNYMNNAGRDNSTSTNELFGFSDTALINCINNAITGPVQPYTACFQSNSSNSGIKVGTSRTSVNGAPVIETGFLFYPQKSVIGDVYGSGMDNFAFWGRNLHEQSSGTPANQYGGATWQLGNYPINENAQASWFKSGTTTETDQMAAYKSKTSVLESEATTVTKNIVEANGATLYMQSDNSTKLGEIGNSDKASYPEGKIWKVTDSLGANTNTTLSNLYYSGKGTLIIHGDLTIAANSQILPLDSNSRLGIIVTGNVAIGNNVKIQAAIFSYGNLSAGSGDYIGSFVAKTFTDNSTSNIRFYYDYALDSAWPPGFRNLNMPHPSED